MKVLSIIYTLNRGAQCLLGSGWVAGQFLNTDWNMSHSGQPLINSSHRHLSGMISHRLLFSPSLGIGRYWFLIFLICRFRHFYQCLNPDLTFYLSSQQSVDSCWIFTHSTFSTAWKCGFDSDLSLYYPDFDIYILIGMISIFQINFFGIFSVWAQLKVFRQKLTLWYFMRFRYVVKT